ncbi:MAG TPA: sigma 54 modulation/S30EA ribosomal C-terminal domain-containing protein [Acidimicrobiia bacterium]|nr:sigma 54 modulation/S30EA ribosomal C-terminal domain-containing protein [Acidimicrobiia bacterium]
MAERVVSRSDPEWLREGRVPSPYPLTVVTRVGVDAASITYALHRLHAALRPVEDQVRGARLKLDLARDPARERPAFAQVQVDLNGDRVRAHVAAHTMRAAADLLERRLRHRLEQRAERREARRLRGMHSGAGEWRHGDLPLERPEGYDRPADEREVVRHKAYTTHELDADEAVFELHQLDYDFHLFRDLATDDDAVIQRRDDGTYLLHRLHASNTPLGPTAEPIEVVPGSAPVLTLDEAIQHLDADGTRFVFFVDAGTRRGRVLYRRYDGHYGLLAPA